MTDKKTAQKAATKTTKPEPIKHHHRLDDFECGNENLNVFLKRRAMRNEIRGASRTYVTTDGNFNAIGYYTLAVGSIEHKDVRSKIKRNMPDPIPVAVLGRLAVDSDWNNQGIGSGLLKEALLKTIEVSEVVGVRAILVHAISDDAKEFYLKHGFEQSPTDEMTLLMSIKDIKKTLSSS